MVASRARPPDSSALCPGCGRAIDPLRAAQVAILDGAFRYFCTAACKKQYVDVASKRVTLDAMTADPPPVAPSGIQEPSFPPPPSIAESGIASRTRTPSRDEIEISGHTDRPSTRRPESDPNARDRHESEPSRDAWRDERESSRDASADESEACREDGAFEETRDARARRRDSSPDRERVQARDVESAPTTLRSIAVEEPVAEPQSERRREKQDDAAPRVSLKERVVVAAPFVGIGAGVLAAIVLLAGEATAFVRLPLAALAVTILVARAALRVREPSEPSPWVVVAGVVPAAIASALTRADAHVAFVGLAAAAALLAQILVERARREIDVARSRTPGLLGARARVVRIARPNSRASAPETDDVEEIDAAQVKPGEQVVVDPGEIVPVDGIVSAGSGEIVPWAESPVVMEKRDGDAVVAGATVVSGRLRVTATFTGAERAWLRNARLDVQVRAPGAARPVASPTTSSASALDVAAPLVAFARRVVERGAPVAALVVAGAVYANNGTLGDVVVAACAGAFAVAASGAVAAAALAHARAHLAAQRRGIVYRDANAFDGAGRADVAVVCSRGTVLLGEPEIVAVEAVGTNVAAEGKAEIARVLSLAAGAEMGSTHPFAAAVHRAARARNVAPEHVRSALKHSGLGVTALAPNGDKVIVGSRAFLLQEKVSVAIADARVSSLEAQGRSVLLVALGGRLVGLLALQDGLRPGARAAVQRLHDAHIEPVLLSGEARDTCETIARALDIDHVRPEILPADRNAEVRALADGGRVVAALGHATSDDGALGAADVSVAMCAAGAAPGEWSVALASDDVRDAALALTVPRACRERAKTIVIVGGAAQALSALGIAFGLLPTAAAPVIAVIAVVSALAVESSGARNA